MSDSTCPSCGYTKKDALLHGDHHLCKNAGKAPWEEGIKENPLVRKEVANLPSNPDDAQTITRLRQELEKAQAAGAEMRKTIEWIKDHTMDWSQDQHFLNFVERTLDSPNPGSSLLTELATLRRKVELGDALWRLGEVLLGELHRCGEPDPQRLESVIEGFQNSLDAYGEEK